MKKITLLLVAAVFAIGIQSCSTEEIGIEEEIQQKRIELNPQESPFNDNSCDNCITVFYPSSMEEATRNYFRNFMRGNVFNTLLKDFTNSCGSMEIWIIDDYDPTLLYNSGIFSENDEIIITEGEAALTVESDNVEETTVPGFKVRISRIDNIPSCN